jgi:hypothetical protein
MSRLIGLHNRAAADVRKGEGFRMPLGVRKPPKHEPAGLRQRFMGISAFARAG